MLMYANKILTRGNIHLAHLKKKNNAANYFHRPTNSLNYN